MSADYQIAGTRNKYASSRAWRTRLCKEPRRASDTPSKPRRPATIVSSTSFETCRGCTRRSSSGPKGCLAPETSERGWPMSGPAAPRTKATRATFRRVKTLRSRQRFRSIFHGWLPGVALCSLVAIYRTSRVAPGAPVLATRYTHRSPYIHKRSMSERPTRRFPCCRADRILSREAKRVATFPRLSAYSPLVVYIRLRRLCYAAFGDG